MSLLVTRCAKTWRCVVARDIINGPSAAQVKLLVIYLELIINIYTY